MWGYVAILAALAWLGWFLYPEVPRSEVFTDDDWDTLDEDLTWERYQ